MARLEWFLFCLHVGEEKEREEVRERRGRRYNKR